MKKHTTATLAIILTLLNVHRYNLPARVWLKAVFNLLDVYCWLLALVCLYIYEDRPIIKSVYFFGVCGVLNALLNESIFIATLPPWSENLPMFGAVLISFAHYIYHLWKIKKKTNRPNNSTSLRK